MKILSAFLRPAGSWGDVVALDGGGFAWLYSVPGNIVCEINAVEAWRTSVPTDFLRFTRATASPVAAALGQGKDDDGYLVTAAGAVAHGVAFGQNPVALGTDGTPYIVRNPDTYTRGSAPVAMPHTSQGIRDVLPDGTVVFGDVTYSGVVRGHPFWQYQTRGDITVGQAGRDVGVGVLAGDDYLVIPRPGEPLGVHQARLANGTLAVCAWTLYGAECWLIDLHAAPEPLPAPDPTPGPIPIPGPPAPPQPVPNPIPEPTPMPQPGSLQTVQRIRSKYPTPLGAQHWEFLVELAQAVGAQLYRKDFGDHCWVPPLNAYVSLDVIGRGALGDVWVDVLGDAENVAVPAWDAHHGAAGVYLDVSGIVLPGQPAPPGPPPNDPLPPVPNPPMPPPVDLSAILRRLDALERPRKVALRTHDGAHFVVAEGGGGGDVNATRTAAGPWETFTLEPL